MNGLLASKRCHSNSNIRNIRIWLSSNNNIANLQNNNNKILLKSTANTIRNYEKLKSNRLHVYVQ